MYGLAKKLKLHSDPENSIVTNSVKLDLMREKVREKLHKAYLGNEIYCGSFQQSDFKNQFNAKLNRKFQKCRIVKPIGNCLYDYC